MLGRGSALLRPDGRNDGLHMRPISVQLSITRRADGSARVSHGLTCALGLVYGPIEIPQSSTVKSSSSRCICRVVLKPLSLSPLNPTRALAAASSVIYSSTAAATGIRSRKNIYNKSLRIDAPTAASIAASTAAGAAAATAETIHPCAPPPVSPPPVSPLSPAAATGNTSTPTILNTAAAGGREGECTAARVAAIECPLAAAAGVSITAEEKDRLRRIESKVHAVLQHLLQPGIYPRCQILLTLLLIQDDGGAEAACINAAVAAALDAGIPLRYRVWAIQIARLHQPPQTSRQQQQQQHLHWHQQQQQQHNTQQQQQHNTQQQQQIFYYKETAPNSQKEYVSSSPSPSKEDGVLLVDLCKEEEEGARRLAAINFVLEPRSGDMVCCFRSSRQSTNYIGGTGSCSTPALCEGGIVWAEHEEKEEEKEEGKKKEEVHNISTTHSSYGVSAALSSAGDRFVGVMMLAALAACREIDAQARLAVAAKLSLATHTFANNNFWWIQQHQGREETHPTRRRHSSSTSEDEENENTVKQKQIKQN